MSIFGTFFSDNLPIKQLSYSVWREWTWSQFEKKYFHLLTEYRRPSLKGQIDFNAIDSW